MALYCCYTVDLLINNYNKLTQLLQFSNSLGIQSANSLITQIHFTVIRLKLFFMILIHLIKIQ